MAAFNVQINAGEDLASSTVSAIGSVTHIITDNERAMFPFSDDQLKDAVNTYFGKRPDEVYLREPTPEHDYTRTGWPQITSTLRPVSATVRSFTSKPVIMATERFANGSTKAGIFNISISEQEVNTTQETWTSNNTIGGDQKLNYTISFFGTGGGGVTSLSYNHAWGQGGTESQATTVGSAQAVSVNLAPGQSVLAKLSAKKGTMIFDIKWQLTLDGRIDNRYHEAYKDFPCWGLWIHNVFNAVNQPLVIEQTDTITVDYFIDSSVQLQDEAGQTVEALHESPADAETLKGVRV